MSRTHELYRHCDNAEITNRQLATLIITAYEEIMDQLTQLQQAVAAEDTVIGSAVALINGIAQRIADAGVDPDALSALTTDIQNQASALAAAVAANTPVTGS